MSRTVPVRRHSAAVAALLAMLLWSALAAALVAQDTLHAALDTITAEELGQHVDVLADDVYEGRLAGSRGGRAAGQYLVEQLRQYDVQPAGTDGSYFQTVDKGGRNVLVLWPGTDPRLRDEVIVVGAHYDHVGNGSRGHILGPKGPIYNGADDNASGVSALLEVIEALATTPIETRRSILFAFWDGEEMGLYGSAQWLDQPTVPLERVPLAINLDMVGRLVDGRLMMYATRTGYGLRRFCSGPLEEPLWLDFTWDLQANGDHWNFVEHKIPVAMLHSGMHDDYHRPTDDADKINRQGMEQVTRYLLALVVKAADADQLPLYRATGLRESPAQQKQRERPLQPASVDRWPAGQPPPRLGISWREDDAEPGTVFLTRVVEGTPAAAAGLAVHDRILSLNGQAFAGDDDFRGQLLDLLNAGATRLSFEVESRGRVRSVSVDLPVVFEQRGAGTEE